MSIAGPGLRQAALAAAGLVALVVMGCAGASDEPPDATPTATEATSAEVAEGLQAGQFGQPIALEASPKLFGTSCTDCTVTFGEPTVQGARIELEGRYFEADDGIYVIVPFTLENRGGESVEPINLVAVSAPTLVEYPNGRQFSHVNLLGLEEHSEELFGVVMADIARPGSTVSGLLVFDVADPIQDGAVLLVGETAILFPKATQDAP